MFCYNRVIKPFLGKYTPPKIVMVDAGDLAKLGEVFGVDALPIHLGGRSELLSVPLSGDGDEERVAGTSSLSATEKPLETSGNDERRPRRDLDDYAWFLRVPAFNFLVVAALVATSARAPALDSTLNDGGRQSRVSRTKAEPNEAGRRLQSREERDGVARHRLARARAGFRGVGERVRDGGMRVVARGEVAAVSTRSGRKWPSGPQVSFHRWI